MASRGAGARAKGRRFEEKIARVLRDIYDVPELVSEINAAAKARDMKLHSELLKESRVRRGRQGEGALEGDLVVERCTWWFELQDVTSVHSYKPEKKLAQAEGDAAASGGFWRCVSICHQTGKRSMQACMRVSTLARSVAALQSKMRLVTTSAPSDHDYPVMIDVEYLWHLLEAEVVAGL